MSIPRKILTNKTEDDGYWVMPDDDFNSLSYDVSKWQQYEWKQIREKNPEIEFNIAAGYKKNKNFVDMTTEVFHSINSHSPRLIPEEELTADGQKARQLHNKLQSTVEFKDIRNRCVGDINMSTQAMNELIIILEGSMQTKNGKKNDKKKKKIKSLVDYLYKEENLLKELKQDMPDTDTKKIEDRIKAIKIELSKLEEESFVNADEFVSELKNNFNHISKKLDDTESVIEFLSSVAGKEDSDHSSDSIEIDQELINKFLKNENLLKAANLAGRLKRIANKKLKENVEGKSELVGITFGNDINRLLPNELLLLSNKKSKYLFAKNFYERSLMQYKLKAKEAKGKGPIVALIDVSGSMNGLKEQYAAAVTMALVGIAAKQKRTLYISHFDTKILSTTKYSKGIALKEVIYSVLHPKAGGNTNIQHCLLETMKYIRSSNEDKELSKSDIVLITDGEDVVNVIDYINLKKKEDNIRICSIMCGGHNKGLKSVSDIYVSATQDIDAAEDVFERVILQ